MLTGIPLHDSLKTKGNKEVENSGEKQEVVFIFKNGGEKRPIFTINPIKKTKKLKKTNKTALGSNKTSFDIKQNSPYYN